MATTTTYVIRTFGSVLAVQITPPVTIPVALHGRDGKGAAQARDGKGVGQARDGKAVMKGK